MIAPPYGAPTVPVGVVADPVRGVGAATVIESARGVAAVTLLASFTCTVKFDVDEAPGPLNVGVPMIVPLEFSVSPAGKVPAETKNVSGATPLAPRIVAEYGTPLLAAVGML